MNRDLYFVAGEVKKYGRSRAANYRVASASRFCICLVLGFGLGPVYQKARRPSIHMRRNVGMRCCFLGVSGIALLWTAVWIFEETPSGAGARIS